MAIAKPPAGASNGELVRWTFAVLDDHDVSALRTMWTDATVERFPSGTVRGADGMTAYFETVFAAVPDLRMRVIALAENGDDVFVRWQLTGTHSGAPFEGIDATGKALALDGMDHFVIRDGTIATNSSSSTRCSSHARSACCRPTARAATVRRRPRSTRERGCSRASATAAAAASCPDARPCGGSSTA